MNKKSKLSPILISGLILLGIALYLMLMGESNSRTSGKLPDSGILDINATTEHVPGVVIDGDIIYVFWQDENSGSVVYSYYSYLGTGSGTGTWYTPDTTTGLQSKIGVDAVLLAANQSGSDEKQICLMLREGQNVAGTPTYACTTRFDTTEGTPSFAWSAINELPMAGTNPPNNATKAVKSIVSVVPSLDGTAFYLARSQFWDDADCVSCKEDRYVENAYTTADASGTLTLTETGHRIGEFFGPSITRVFGDTTPYYTFFENGRDQNRITYADLSIQPQEDQKLVVLKDKKDKKPETKDRIATLYSEQQGYLYVAYRNVNNEGIRFSKINKQQWDVDLGSGLWSHCDLQEKPDNGDKRYIAQSLSAPMLFEYDGAVYILYSESRNWTYPVDENNKVEKENVISYQRIDNIDPDSPTCTGNFN